MSSARTSVRAGQRPFRLVAPQASEDVLHEQCRNVLDRLLAPPAQWTTFPAGGYGLSAPAAARLSRLGLKPGWPDILIVHNERLYGIELKTRDGRLSRTRIVRTRSGGARVRIGQEDMLADLERAGVRTAVCRSAEAVLEQLAAWRIPLRGHVTSRGHPLGSGHEAVA